MSAEAFARLGRLLNAHRFSAYLHSVRSRQDNPHEPWLELSPASGCRAHALHEAFDVLHRGQSVAHPLSSESAAILREAEVCGFSVSSRDATYPGRWRLSGFGDLYAVADRDGRVHFGDDSCIFASALLEQRTVRSGERVRGLDVGSGSGISAAALASYCDEVLAIDIDPACTEATRCTADVNGCRGVTAVTGNAFELDASERFDVMASNPPDIPVPAGLSYSSAATGGPDGLANVRSILELAIKHLSPRGRLVMRFYSLGDERGPIAADVIEAVCAQHGFEGSLDVRSRFPIAVRSALSAMYAGPHNPGRTELELLDAFDAHYAALGASYFYACVLTLDRSHAPKLQRAFRPTAIIDDATLFERGPSAARDRSAERDTALRLAIAYTRALRNLPDGCWELVLDRHVYLPLFRFDAIRQRLLDGASVAEATRSELADELRLRPARARALLVLTGLVAASATDLGLLRQRSARPPSASAVGEPGGLPWT